MDILDEARKLLGSSNEEEAPPVASKPHDWRRVGVMGGREYYLCPACGKGVSCRIGGFGVLQMLNEECF